MREARTFSQSKMPGTDYASHSHLAHPCDLQWKQRGEGHNAAVNSFDGTYTLLNSANTRVNKLYNDRERVAFGCQNHQLDPLRRSAAN